MSFCHGIWRLNKNIGQVYVPKGAELKGVFVAEHPFTKTKVEVHLAGTQLQSGDVAHIDENGVVKDVYSDEERGWFWYSLARSGILIFLSSFVVSYLLEFGAEMTGADGKMSYFGFEVLPSTAVTTTLLISFFAIAILSPILGACADFTAHRKSMLGAFALLGIMCSFALAPTFYVRNLPACLVFTYTIIFCYEITVSLISAYLPEITPAKKIPKLSGYGVLLTTTSQVLALIFVVPVMSIPGGVEEKTTADSGIKFYLSVCACGLGGVWAIGTILTLLLLKSRPARRQMEASQSILAVGFIQLMRVGKKTRMFPELFRFLLSYILSSTAFGTVTSLASIVLSSDFGWEGSELAYLMVISQVVGMVGGLTAHRLTNKFGAKRVLISVLTVYALACPVVCFLYYSRGPCILNDWSPCEATGKCFRRFDTPMTLSEANDFCRSEVRRSDRGQVAPYRSSAELSCGASLCDSGDCWVNRRFVTSWTETGDERMTFWFTQGATEPSPPTQGDCVAMNATSFWTAALCEEARPFVCEKDLIYEADTTVKAILFGVFLILTYFGGLHIAISRAYVALMIPPDLEAEVYGLYGFCGKALIWVGVAMFAVVNEVFGDFRWGFLLMVPFFVLGGWNLFRVNDAIVQENVKEYMVIRHKAMLSCMSFARAKLNSDS